MGVLRTRTRVLVTNALQYLPQVGGSPFFLSNGVGPLDAAVHE